MSGGHILYGFHAVLSGLRHGGGVKEVYLDQARQDPRVRQVLDAAERAGVKVRQVDRRRLDGMAPQARHQGVVAVADEAAATPAKTLDDILEMAASEPLLLLVLDGVQDPHNLGACLRVADAMGAHAVVVPKDRAVGLTPTVRKVASGAAETVPFVTVTNLARSLRDMRDAGLWVVGLDGEVERSMTEADLSGPLALVMGAEGEGLRRLTREACDELVRIPMFGRVESLNVSVASGICLYEARRRRLAVANPVKSE